MVRAARAEACESRRRCHRPVGRQRARRQDEGLSRQEHDRRITTVLVVRRVLRVVMMMRRLLYAVMVVRGLSHVLVMVMTARLRSHADNAARQRIGKVRMMMRMFGLIHQRDV